MLFSRRNKEEYTDSLAAYMPGGILFASKSIHDSNFRKLLLGLSNELFRVNGYLKEYSEDFIPDITEKFISEWERALGIPDSCFKANGDLNTRRLHVIIKLSSIGLQTVEDFQELANLFGIPITISSGSINGTFPLEFPAVFYPTGSAARHTIVVYYSVTGTEVYPWVFPYIFGTEELGILECLLAKLIPANCDLLLIQV